MRLSARHVAESFDPGAGQVASGSSSLLERVGRDWRGVLLLAGDQARSEGWASAAAVALARAWAGGERKIVLIDLSLESPELHQVLKLPNLEGVVDVFLFGSSLGRVAQRVPSEDFQFIAAGQFAPEPAELREDARWRKLIAAGTDPQSVLLLYVPATVAGVAGLASMVEHVVLLSAASELTDLETQIPPGCVVEATLLGPSMTEPVTAAGASAAVTSAEAVPVEVQPERDAVSLAVDEWIAALGPDPLAGRTVAEATVARSPDPLAETGSTHWQAPGPQTATVVADPVPARVELSEPPLASAAPKPRRKSRSRRSLTLLLLVLVAAAATAAWLFAGRRGPVSISDPGGSDVSQVEPGSSPVDALPSGPEPSADPRGAAANAAPLAGAASSLDPSASRPVPPVSAVAPAPSTVPPAAAGPGAPATGASVVSTAPASSATGSLAVAVPYSVAIEAHRSYALAREKMVELGRAEPDVRFYIAPVFVDDVLYYRLLAGPVTTEAASADLMRRLVAAGRKAEYEAWAIRPTRFAYDFGEFETAELADQRMLQLERVGVPAYRLEVPYADGAVRYRLYAGAYANAAEAEPLAQSLQRAGLSAELVPRTGRPVP
jgi:hypothetical protein